MLNIVAAEVHWPTVIVFTVLIALVFERISRVRRSRSSPAPAGGEPSRFKASRVMATLLAAFAVSAGLAATHVLRDTDSLTEAVAVGMAGSIVPAAAVAAASLRHSTANRAIWATVAVVITVIGSSAALFVASN